MESCLVFGILLVFYASDGYASNDTRYLSDVSTLMKEVKSITGPVGDVLKEFTQIVNKDKIKALLGLAGPVGSLIAVALDLGFNLKSEVSIALGKLQDDLRIGFEDTALRIDRLLPKVSLDNRLENYQNAIHVPLKNLEEAFIDATINNTRSAKRKTKLLEKCSTIQDVFNFIIVKIVDSCPNPIELHTTNYLNTYNNISALESKIPKQFANSSFLILKQEILNRATAARTDISKILYDFHTAVEDLNDETDIETAKPILDKFNNDLLYSDSDQKHFPCLLQSVLNVYFQKRNPLLALAQIISRDAIRLSLYAGLCANVTFGKEESEAKLELDKTVIKANSIFYKMSHWIPEKLGRAFPRTMKAVAETSVNKQLSSDNWQYYAEYAHIVASELDERGPENWKHQVLISDASNFDVNNKQQYYHACDTEDICLIIGDYRGVNIAIFRYDEQYSVKQITESFEWLMANRNTIEEVLKAEKADLAEVYNDISYKVTGNLRKYYSSVLLLHISTIFASSAEIYIGEHCNKIDIIYVGCETSILYWTNGFHAHMYRALFFI